MHDAATSIACVIECLLNCISAIHLTFCEHGGCVLQIAWLGGNGTIFGDVEDLDGGCFFRGDLDFSCSRVCGGIRKAVVEIYRVFAGLEIGRQGNADGEFIDRLGGQRDC